jgi:hypothetical protein
MLISSDEFQKAIEFRSEEIIAKIQEETIYICKWFDAMKKTKNTKLIGNGILCAFDRYDHSIPDVTKFLDSNPSPELLDHFKNRIYVYLFLYASDKLKEFIHNRSNYELEYIRRGYQKAREDLENFLICYS